MTSTTLFLVLLWTLVHSSAGFSVKVNGNGNVNPSLRPSLLTLQSSFGTATSRHATVNGTSYYQSPILNQRSNGESHSNNKSGKEEDDRDSSPPVIPTADLESIEFVSSGTLERPSDLHMVDDSEHNYYPFAGMLRNSARYIADHSHRTAVFYIPGDEILAKAQRKQQDQQLSTSTSVGTSHTGIHDMNKLFGDIALAWMLGLRIVLVVGCKLDYQHHFDQSKSPYPTDGHDKVVQLEEEAGFIRFEVERLLSRHLRLHGTGSRRDVDMGNVIGGNFYTARSVDDDDPRGYPTKIHTERIEQTLHNNDIVLLSTVGTSRMGELVHVHGPHLAATVAAALKARKLVYMSMYSDIVMRRANNKNDDKTLQEVPLTFTKALLEHYDIKVNKAGFVSSSSTLSSLSSEEQQLLQHLAWSAWALDQGVNRAHIVNPGDGSLLEELFSSKLGLNTCVYHEDEADDLDLDDEYDY